MGHEDLLGMWFIRVERKPLMGVPWSQPPAIVPLGPITGTHRTHPVHAEQGLRRDRSKLIFTHGSWQLRVGAASNKWEKPRITFLKSIVNSLCKHLSCYANIFGGEAHYWPWGTILDVRN